MVIASQGGSGVSLLYIFAISGSFDQESYVSQLVNVRMPHWAIEQSSEGMRGVNRPTYRRNEVGHPDNRYRFRVTGSEVNGEKASNDL